MGNGASRIFDVMKNTSEATNTVASFANLSVKSIEPLIFILDDRTEITSDFYILDSGFDPSIINIGDVVGSIVLNAGQAYYIISNSSAGAIRDELYAYIAELVGNLNDLNINDLSIDDNIVSIFNKIYNYQIVDDCDNITSNLAITTSNALNVPTNLNSDSCMVISMNPGSNYDVQLAFSYGANELAIRRKNNSSTFSSWVAIQFPLFDVGTDLASGTDLNSVVTYGVYRIANGTIGQSLLHSPYTEQSATMDVAGKLIVENIQSNNYIIRQTLMLNHTRSLTWVRTRTSNTNWGKWMQLATLDTISGTVTTDANGRFSPRLSRDYDILSVTVMRTSGGINLTGTVYSRNDATTHVIYVRDTTNAIIANTEITYRIRYIQR